MEERSPTKQEVQNSWNEREQLGFGVIDTGRAHGKNLWKLEKDIRYGLMFHIVMKWHWLVLISEDIDYLTSKLPAWEMNVQEINNELCGETDIAYARWWENECQQIELEKMRRPHLFYVKVKELSKRYAEERKKIAFKASKQGRYLTDQVKRNQ